MAENEQSKTEQPTPFRLQEARNKGQVPRSTEVTGLLVTVVFSITLCAIAHSLAGVWAHCFQRMMLMAGNAPSPSVSLVLWIAATFRPVWQAMIPLVIALLVTAVIANLVQTGPVFSTEPLKPDFSRLNPAQGFKRIFSLRLLWDLFKLVFKVSLLAGMAWWLTGSLQHQVLATATAAPSAAGELMRSVYVRVTTWVLAVLAFVALMDLLFSRREYLRKLRMSRNDIKDEVKRREGDPDIRHKRKRLMVELLKQSRSIRRVPDADVVLTNPTHLAVALQYRPRTMRSPVVLAKGTDAVAAAMRSKAAVSGVPCLRSPALARALFRECNVDKPVPDHLYAQLAPVYRWLMGRSGNRIFS
ncbi:EscU/YscU/HrcU family type III secretion system export apparatus switch protein [Dyella halodurans]|uniref:Flagellar biosynthesis protein FlhB n=1 Tax=Dyella halodurans TaxID=1920171 RepID=A0ABV9C3N0_9GAMM|nr:EscU/YscU/HrcU family type III secretion system export apparatus switch protein [Dyella halodurans]